MTIRHMVKIPAQFLLYAMLYIAIHRTPPVPSDAFRISCLQGWLVLATRLSDGMRLTGLVSLSESAYRFRALCLVLDPTSF